MACPPEDAKELDVHGSQRRAAHLSPLRGPFVCLSVPDSGEHGRANRRQSAAEPGRPVFELTREDDQPPLRAIGRLRPMASSSAKRRHAALTSARVSARDLLGGTPRGGHPVSSES